MDKDEKVCFDPGYSKFSCNFPEEIPEIIDQIAKLKQQHQKKFEFQKLEAQVVAIIKNNASIYLGCILWGCYLHYKYKNDSREITGNLVKETGSNPEYNHEIDFILNTIEKLNKASVFYLKRPCRIDKKIIGYFNAYKEFAQLNNNFLELDNTADIKIPTDFKYFEDYNDEKLDELKLFIENVIKSDKIENIFLY